MIRHLSTAFVLTGLLALSVKARAQDPQPPEAPVKADSTTQPTTSGAATGAAATGAAKPGEGASAQGRAPTKEQIATFSRMVHHSEAAVAARVESDAAARDLVLHAVEARESRRGTGKALVITGGSLLVLGNIAGSLIMFTAPGYPAVDENDVGRILLGLGVSVVSTAVGLALGIPGVVKLARTGDVERQAITDYRMARASSIERPLPPAAPVTLAGHSRAPSAALVLPVVSLSF